MFDTFIFLINLIQKKHNLIKRLLKYTQALSFLSNWSFIITRMKYYNLLQSINYIKKNQFFFFFCTLRGTHFRVLYKFFFWLFVLANCFLGWLGAQVVEAPYIQLSIITTLFYFFYLLILIPLIESIEKLLFIQINNLNLE
jgi:quinol-cytochrome oxidoreductase complex cytochrome b subunit